MSLISRTVRTDSNAENSPTVELDVARHLWADPEVGIEGDAETAFNLTLTNDCTGVLLLQSGSLPQRIVYRLVNDSRSILLQPIVLNNNFNVQVHNLKINLPDKILANCFVINSFTNNDGLHFIIIDAISESGALFTISFAVTQFFEGSLTINTEVYQEWCYISNAYGFDIRKPHLLYSYSSEYTVVLLKDGGIIGLQKNLINFAYEPVLFNDNSYFESLGKLFKPWSNKSKLVVPSGLSEKTVIDCVHYEDLLITITINKKLRVWSRSEQTLLLEKNLNEFVLDSTSNKDLLDSQPTKLLSILDTKDNGTFLSIFLPFGNGIFKIFKLQSSPLDIIDLGSNFEFKVSLPESTSIWSVGDFKLVSKAKTLQLWVLWKSGASSVIQSLSIKEDASSEWNITTQTSPNGPFVSKLDNEDWSQFYNRKIFQNYSNQIIVTALSIFRTHFLPQTQEPVDDMSILDKMNYLVGSGITFDKNYNYTLETQWARFDSLCQEFQKQAKESLKLHIEDDFIFLINREGISTIRTLTELEYYLINRAHYQSVNIPSTIAPKLKFLNIISNFKSSLDKEIQEDILNSIVLHIKRCANSKPIKQVSVDIYDFALNNKVNSNNLNSFVEQLSELEDLLQIVGDFLLLLERGSTGELLASVSSKLTSQGSSLVSVSVSQILGFNFTVLFDLFILLLVLEFENKELVNSYLGKIFELFRKCFIYKTTLEINLTTELKLDIDEVTSLDLSNHLLNSHLADGLQFTNDALLSVLQGQLVKYVNTEDYLHETLVFLISHGYSDLAYSKFLPFLNDSSAIGQLLRSVIFFKIGRPEHSLKYFILNESLIALHKLTPEQKKILAPIDDFTVFCNTKLSKYYLNLAILFLNNFYFVQASQFIHLCISKKNFINDQFDEEYREQKFHCLFTIALELQDLANVKFALNNITSESLKRESLKRLISKLLKTKSVDKLLEFDFLKNEKLVDELLYERACASNSGFDRTLLYYKMLFSFRFKNKDFRSAVEALYEFIYKFQPQANVEQLITISDLYILVLNSLKNFKDDDKWIIYHINEGEDDVLSFDELKNQQRILNKEIKRLQTV